MFRFVKFSRASGGSGYTFPTTPYSSLPATICVSSRTSVTPLVIQKNPFSTNKKISYKKLRTPKKSSPKACPKPSPTVSVSTPSALTPLDENNVATARPWPARTAQGYICKNCSSLGRGNYCDKHKEVKNVHLMTTASQSSPGSGLTKFAKDHPSLTFAALCLLQHVADSPIAQ
jgi:hypothetical protein